MDIGKLNGYCDLLSTFGCDGGRGAGVNLIVRMCTRLCQCQRSCASASIASVRCLVVMVGEFGSLICLSNCRHRRPKWADAPGADLELTMRRKWLRALLDSLFDSEQTSNEADAVRVV